MHCEWTTFKAITFLGLWDKNQNVFLFSKWNSLLSLSFQFNQLHSAISVQWTLEAARDQGNQLLKWSMSPISELGCQLLLLFVNSNRFQGWERDYRYGARWRSCLRVMKQRWRIQWRNIVHAIPKTQRRVIQKLRGIKGAPTKWK